MRDRLGWKRSQASRTCWRENAAAPAVGVLPPGASVSPSLLPRPCWAGGGPLVPGGARPKATSPKRSSGPTSARPSWPPARSNRPARPRCRARLREPSPPSTSNPTTSSAGSRSWRGSTWATLTYGWLAPSPRSTVRGPTCWLPRPDLPMPRQRCGARRRCPAGNRSLCASWNSQGRPPSAHRRNWPFPRPNCGAPRPTCRRCGTTMTRPASVRR